MKLTKDQKAIYEYEGMTFFEPQKGSRATEKKLSSLRKKCGLFLHKIAGTYFVCVNEVRFSCVSNLIIAERDLTKYLEYLKHAEQMETVDHPKEDYRYEKILVGKIIDKVEETKSEFSKGEFFGTTIFLIDRKYFGSLYWGK